MIAAQRSNHKASIPVSGITSNGATWQFGKLEAEVFLRNTTFYSLQDPESLLGAVNYLFHQCEQQLRQYAISS
ncbi:MAG: hypothetical protein K6T90_15915 [Leptolyngbyaceae cyanobacterium HOT.MB2.61]|nr:hypothetical protein [Leptolyngbyaceae cyanobacterium HOT.MB2.61]